jgi:ribosomal protein S6
MSEKSNPRQKRYLKSQNGTLKHQNSTLNHQNGTLNHQNTEIAKTKTWGTKNLNKK